MQRNIKKKMTAQELCNSYAAGHRDFSNIILKNQSLRDADLRGANFSGANLKQTNFKRAKLQDTNFSRAKLQVVDFSRANLTAANFSQAETIDLPHWGRIFILVLLIISTFGSFLLLLPFLLPFRGIWLRTTKFNQSNLNSTNFRAAKLKQIDFSKSLNLEKVNFHSAWLQRANFRGLNLEKSDFSSAKLYDTNFSKTTLRKANFQHSKSGVHFNFGNSLLKAISLSLGGFLIAPILAMFLCLPLHIQVTVTQTDIQYSFIFTYIVILLVGFFHFLSTGLYKNMDEALTGIGFMVGSILLVMTNQPIIITLTWFIILVGVIRIIQILLKENPLASKLILLLLSVTFVALIYNYNYIRTLDWTPIETTIVFLIMLIPMSIRIAVTIAEIELISGWGKWISSLISIALFLVVNTFLVVTKFFINVFFGGSDPIGIIYVTTVTTGSILLGTYIGLQTIKDNPNYRVIRDRAVSFCHWLSRFGTQFRGSNLTLADFSFASLKNADFTNANLTHAVWYKVRQLQYARFGRNNYLRYPQIRQILTQQTSHFPRQSRHIRKWILIYRNWPKVLKKLIHACLTKKPYKLSKNFDKCDLRGIRLSCPRSSPYSDNLPDQSLRHQPFNLSHASFEEADLRHSDLRGANLRGVNFIGAQLDQADLSGSDITDACIQNWQITPETNFEQVRCKRLQLEKKISQDIEPASKNFNEGESLNFSKLQTLIIPVEDQRKLDELKSEFAKLNLIRNRINRKYYITQQANRASDSYGIDSELYCKMFEDYRREKVQVQRQQSWYQSILWFKIEPWIEKINQLTQELDIFPLLENLGRLSILIAVITFINSILKPDVDIEKQYRPWEIIHSDTQQKVRGVSRYALEQLQAEGSSLENLQAPNVDLQRINLSNLNLSYANLKGAKLQEADLKGANLKNANLSGAKLQEADLKGANLKNANLSGAKLQKAELNTYNPYINFDSPKGLIPTIFKQDTNLREADLTEADLTEADLTGADLTRADLTGADLTGADLTGADLTRADLTGADIAYANLQDISWNKRTNWKKVKGCETARNIPEELKQKLGL